MCDDVAERATFLIGNSEEIFEHALGRAMVTRWVLRCRNWRHVALAISTVPHACSKASHNSMLEEIKPYRLTIGHTRCDTSAHAHQQAARCRDAG